MYRKDYIQRQFEEFGKVLASLLLLRKNQDWEAFEKELEVAAAQVNPPEQEHILRLSGPRFEEELLSSGLEYLRKKMLASLLFEHMNACYERGLTEEAEALRKKCLFLYDHLAHDLTQNEYDLEVHYRLKVLSR